MFDNTVADGSIWAVVLMIYVYGVMYNIGEVYVKDPTGVMTPDIVRSSLGTKVIIAMVPTIIWPAIYVSLFDGILWSGVVTFLITTVGGGIAGKLLGVTIHRNCCHSSDELTESETTYGEPRPRPPGYRYP